MDDERAPIRNGPWADGEVPSDDDDAHARTPPITTALVKGKLLRALVPMPRPPHVPPPELWGATWCVATFILFAWALADVASYWPRVPPLLGVHATRTAHAIALAAIHLVGACVLCGAVARSLHAQLVAGVLGYTYAPAMVLWLACLASTSTARGVLAALFVAHSTRFAVGELAPFLLTRSRTTRGALWLAVAAAQTLLAAGVAAEMARVCLFGMCVDAGALL